MDAHFFGETMAASSVTGTGLGESYGKQKPHLHSGCGCCGQTTPQPRSKPKKKGCFFSYSAKNNNSISYKINSNFRSEKIC